MAKRIGDQGLTTPKHLTSAGTTDRNLLSEKFIGVHADCCRHHQLVHLTPGLIGVARNEHDHLLGIGQLCGTFDNQLQWLQMKIGVGQESGENFAAGAGTPGRRADPVNKDAVIILNYHNGLPPHDA